MSNGPTEQELFWSGNFGEDYTDRNSGSAMVASNLGLLSQALRRARGISSVLELGANRGMNLAALHALLPSATLAGVEINAKACEELGRMGYVDVHQGSIFDFRPQSAFDLVLIKGVLIHLNPDRLGDAYDVIHASSNAYVLLAEYYNPTPVTVEYRGHSNRLFKRDFAGELLDRFHDLRLIDYGFAYRRDPVFPQDDLTWFLLQKSGSR